HARARRRYRPPVARRLRHRRRHHRARRRARRADAQRQSGNGDVRAGGSLRRHRHRRHGLAGRGHRRRAHRRRRHQHDVAVRARNGDHRHVRADGADPAHQTERSLRPRSARPVRRRFMTTTKAPILAGGIAGGPIAPVLANLRRWRVPLSVPALCILPWVLPSQALAVNVLIFGLIAVGYNLLFGYTGLLSFGHAAFFGAGAYTTGIAISHFGAHWFLAMVAGVVVAGVLALVMGALAIRTRGIYFAMVTLALSQLVYYTALQASSWTGGENGLRGFTVSRLDFPGFSIDFLDPVQKYYAIMVVVAAALWFVSRVLN